MITAARMATEPEADADPRDTMLDLFESQVRALKSVGAEPEMRARLDRLLPPPKTAAPPALPPPAATSAVRDADAELDLSRVLVALREAHKRLGGEIMRKQLGAATEIVERLLAAATGKGPAGQASERGSGS